MYDDTVRTDTDSMDFRLLQTVFWFHHSRQCWMQQTTAGILMWSWQPSCQ